MGRALQMANELNAYTITDRGTWLVMRSQLSLKLLAEGDAELYNPYSISRGQSRTLSKYQLSGSHVPDRLVDLS